MNSIAATPVLRPPPTRIAPALEEERTPPATVAAGGEAQAQQDPKFSDVVAILNPLQNLPIVGTIYRKLTDDVPHPAARALGGLLWGGPFGLVGAILTYVAEQVSGKSTTEIVKSIFDGDGSAPSVAEQPAAVSGTGGMPQRLLPPDEAGMPGRADSPAPVATPRFAQASPASTAAPTPPQPQAATARAPGELQPRNTAVRDLAFYQAHAGARLPPASTAVAPTGGPQAATSLPSFQRAVAPVLGSEPIGPAAAPPANASPASPQDFMRQMMRGIDRYEALNRRIDAPARAATLDRVE